MDYVNVKMGTASTVERSCGNTNPLTGRPHGMNNFIVQTRDVVRGWPFLPWDVRTSGIRLTHIASPWIGDYLKLVMMPTAGSEYGAATDGARESSYDTKRAVMTPARIAITLLRYGIDVELTATERGGILRAHYCEALPRFLRDGDQHRFVLDFRPKEDTDGAFCEIDAGRGILRGYTNNCHARGYENAPEGLRIYFVLKFNASFDAARSLMRDGVCNVCFTNSPSDIECRFATSYISLAQAEQNLDAEVGEKSFETLLSEAEDAWEGYLSRIELDAENEVKRTFYSCLYRSFLFPRKFHEVTREGRVCHFSPVNGKVCDGPFYTDNGFWDTYKTVYPLYSLIAADDYAEMCEGFLNYYREGGWLPRWASPFPMNSMPGTAIDAVFGDAAVKGVVTDEKTLSLMLESLMKHIDTPSDNPTYGRDGWQEYRDHGYVLRPRKENVSKTLDYAYGDFCVARIAELLGKEEIKRRLDRSARAYRRLFDPETGFLRGRDKDGKFAESFSEFDWGGDYVEGSVWQTGFAVYHDLLGYAKLLGGREAFLARIQRLFDTPPYFNQHFWSVEQHEMTEMALQGIGQCGINNQPSFHIPYLFACMGDRDKTAYWVRRAVRELFSATPDGFPGDEDNGSMATWYVFSALGFYPVCPGVPEYVVATPSVRRAVLHMDNGKTLTVSAPKNSDTRVYATAIRKDGKKLRRTAISHADLRCGGTLSFVMSETPSGQTYSDSQLPYSMTKKI